MTEAELRKRAPRRAQVLDFIRGEIAAGRRFPSNASIIAHMGWKSTSGIGDVLQNLFIDGFLSREASHPHSMLPRYVYALKTGETP